MPQILQHNGNIVRNLTGAFGIDNCTPENIKSGVTIAGVTGNFVGTIDRTILDNNSWADIKQMVDNGTAPSDWIGQSKKITEGTYAGYIIKCVDLTSNRYEKTDGTGYTNAVFQFLYLINQTYRMNSSATNVGGWASCSLRTTLNSTIYNALPTDIKNVISQCKVLSGTGDNTTSGTSSSDNYLFLPCQYEVFGSVNNSVIGESSNIFSYYATNTIYKNRYGTSFTSNQWSRSPQSGNNQRFDINGSTAGTAYLAANQTAYIAPCFAI